MTLTPSQIASYAYGAGFRGLALAVAVAIAEAESTGDPGAISPTSDYGLWQVNAPDHPGYSTAYLLTPDGSAAAAYAISSGGADWTPWTTYKNGAYRNFLSQAQQAAASVGQQTPGVPVQVAQAGIPAAGLLLLGAALLALVW